MQNTSIPVAAAGFQEMWQPVYDKYKLFFDCGTKLVPIVHEMFTAPIEGPLLMITGHILAAAVNSYGAVLTLALNGYGHDALIIARSIYEAEINILWLKNHPDDVHDFIDYNHIQTKQLYDSMDDDSKKAVSKERLDQIMGDYQRVLPRFASARDKTLPRNQWCRVSIYQRAKDAEAHWQKQLEAEGNTGQSISLYKTFYWHASSLHHLDIAGVIAHMDSDMNAQFAPLLEHVDDALMSSSASILRAVDYFNDMAKLGLGARLKEGPVADFLSAYKNLSQ